ncbi:MAG: polymer-forming cytoskeletal protein [Spirochaetes bacterium]|nr:polymer-forming cytoskeletal protein [Spirochaetota bacterium]
MVKNNESKMIEEKDVDTVLAEDIDFSGTMKFKNSLMIKGKFDGEIDAEGHLILGPNAVIKATIRTGVLTNYGKIIGNVEAIDKIELLRGAELNGDVKTPDLIVESGCILNGKCTMGPQVYNAHKGAGPKVVESQAHD